MESSEFYPFAMDTVTDYIKRWFEITGFDWDAESWTFTLLDLKYGTTENNGNVHPVVG